MCILPVVYPKAFMWMMVVVILHPTDGFFSCLVNGTQDKCVQHTFPEAFLNAEGFLVVFWHTTPLFNLPLIAINLAEFRNSKIYVLFDNEGNTPIIHKYLSEETIMWRFFVWDRTKTKEYSAKKVDFKDSLNTIVEY